MKLWLGEKSFDTTWFGLQCWEGVTGDDARHTLCTLMDLRQSRLTSPQLSFPSQGVAVLQSEESISTWHLCPEYTSVSMHLLGESKACLRFLERVAHDLNPERVQLFTYPCEGASGVQPYSRSGLLFLRTLQSRHSSYQRIELGEHPAYGRLLLLNGEVQISESDEHLYSQTLATMGLRESTKRVCILGGGDCGVLREVLALDVESVVMVELDREVVTFCEHHFPEVVAESLSDPRVEVLFEDAFGFLECTSRAFDLVIYDLSDEPIDGISHDQLVARLRRVLTTGGRLVLQCGSSAQWSKPHLDGLLNAMQRTFRDIHTEQVLIPSFNEVPWVFTSASGLL